MTTRTGRAKFLTREGLRLLFTKASTFTNPGDGGAQLLVVQLPCSLPRHPKGFSDGLPGTAGLASLGNGLKKPPLHFVVRRLQSTQALDGVLGLEGNTHRHVTSIG